MSMTNAAKIIGIHLICLFDQTTKQQLSNSEP